MDDQIQEFMMYLRNVKKASENTIMSYQSDLTKMMLYVKQQGAESTDGITPTVLNAYVLQLERNGLAASTISRYIASMKAFFEYLVRSHQLQDDPSCQLKAPKVEKRLPGILSVQEMEHLLEQPDVDNPKGCRDKAMLELLYATGMRVSELVHLHLEDVNLKFGWVICRDGVRERMVPFGTKAGAALMAYLDRSRSCLQKKDSSELLFLNCSGAPMSRQGFWKVLKSYAQRAGIDKDITPRMFRHSCAAHMASNGAELQTIQEILGHADMTATQIYAGFQPGMKKEYSKVHPRG